MPCTAALPQPLPTPLPYRRVALLLIKVPWVQFCTGVPECKLLSCFSGFCLREPSAEQAGEMLDLGQNPYASLHPNLTRFPSWNSAWCSQRQAGGSSPGACGLCRATGAWHSSPEGCCQSSIWRERETGLLSGLSTKVSGHVYSEPDMTLEEEVGVEQEEAFAPSHRVWTKSPTPPSHPPGGRW